MRTLWLGVAIGLALVACKPKKQDRGEVCDTAKQVFKDGMKQALSGQTLTAEQRAMADTMLTKADANFRSYCMQLSEADMECISHFQERQNDPGCSHIKADAMKKLFGM